MIERLIHEHLKDFSGSRILDVGPGYSDFSRYSARLIGASSITFLDNNRKVLAFQKERNRAEGVSSETVCDAIQVETIAALPGQFDLIHCQEVLEHIPNPEGVLTSLASKLVDRGKIIVTVPTACSERWIRRVNRTYMRDELAGHAREFDEKELRRMLARAGLVPDVLLPAQPQFFIGHLWLFGARTPVDASTGRVYGNGVRERIFRLTVRTMRSFFFATDIEFWSRLFPRNYFTIARRGSRADTC